MNEPNRPLVADRAAADSPVVRVRAGACRRTINEYLVQMSHELRTPLNAIIGMSGLILEGEPETKQRQYAKGIYAAGETLSAILNDVLDLSRIAENCLTIEPISFDLRSMVEETAKTLTARAEDRGLTLRVDWRPDVPRQVSGDPGRIRQVLGNLVGHAIHATSRGDVVIQVAADTASDDTRSVLFSIADSGIGIPPTRMERVFDEYVPVDASPYRSFCVTGLGLRISAELVRVMGGEIGAESVLGQGSSFWFSLPLIVADSAADRARPQVRASTGGRALVVELDHLGRERFSQQIEAAGWRIDFAEELTDVSEILVEAHRSGDGFSACIFSDYAVRPGHEELARRLKADVGLQHIALLMVTAVGSPGEGKRLWHAGFAAYLRKPLPNEELRETLAALEQVGRDGRGASLITRHSLAEAKNAQSLASDEGIEEVLASLWLDTSGVMVEPQASFPESVESVTVSDVLPGEAAVDEAIEPELLLTDRVMEPDIGTLTSPAAHEPAAPTEATPDLETSAAVEPSVAVVSVEIQAAEGPLPAIEEPVSDEAQVETVRTQVEPVTGFIDEGFIAEAPVAPAEGLLTNDPDWDLASGAAAIDPPGLISVGESMWEGGANEAAPTSLVGEPPVIESIETESLLAENAEPTSSIEAPVDEPGTTEGSASEAPAEPTARSLTLEATRLFLPILPPLPPAIVAFAARAQDETSELVDEPEQGSGESVVAAAITDDQPASGSESSAAIPSSSFELTVEEAPPFVGNDEQLAIEREGDGSIESEAAAESAAAVSGSDDASQLDLTAPFAASPSVARPEIASAGRSAVVSEAILQQLARGGSPLATQLVATFLREAPARISEVATSATRGDLARARQSLVSLKGMCGLLGAAQLSDAVTVAYHAAESGDIAPVAGELGRIEQAFLEVRLAVEQATPAEEAGAPAPPVDASFLEQVRSGAGARRPTMATRLAATFLAETPGWMTDLDQATEKEDGQGVQRLAQMLKATASIIGAAVLVSRAGQIEASARLARFDEVRDGVQEARREAERVAEALRSSM